MNTKNDFGIGYESKNKTIELLVCKINIINERIDDINNWNLCCNTVNLLREELREMKRQIKMELQLLIDQL